MRTDIALAEGEAHGYAIMRAVAERTEGRRRLGPGTLYTALKRLLYRPSGGRS